MLDEGEHQEKDLTAVHLTSKHLRDLKNVSVYGQRLLLTRLMVSLGCHFHSLLMCVVDNSKEHYMLFCAGWYIRKTNLYLCYDSDFTLHHHQ